MSINPITFGVPSYDPPFSVSTGDVDNLKLRSKEIAPLSHESLDENFCNLANKINEILNLGISDVTITGGVISAANLQVSGSGVISVSGTGVISHANRTAASGYNIATLDGTTDKVVNGLIADSHGHVTGIKTRVIDLSPYATTDSLSNYATTSSLSNYATTSSLSGYATTDSLSNYATTSSLSNYATTSSLSGYATTDSLSNYALTTSLSGYATTMELSTTNGNVNSNTANISTNATDISTLQTSISTLDTEKLDAAALSFDSGTGVLTITTS